jgi:hypothetical protein
VSNYGVFGGLFAPVKHRIFVSYHHGGDQFYYDQFSKAFHDTYEVIFDTSLERRIGSNDHDYVMRKIREDYISGSSCTVVLVGRDTWRRKFVDWEVKATLDKDHGLIAVQLPTCPINPNGTVNVPTRLNSNINSRFALWLTWQDITASTTQLERYVADAKSRDTRLIINPRDVRLSNA